MTNFDPEKIIEEFKERVIPIRGRYSDFCMVSDIGYDWLSKFMNGRIKNPTLKTLKALDDGIIKWNDFYKKSP